MYSFYITLWGVLHDRSNLLLVKFDKLSVITLLGYNSSSIYVYI